MKPQSCTLLVRQQCGVFTAAAQHVEMSGLSATLAARAAGAKLLGVPEHRVEVEVVDHGERGSTRQVLRASVKRPASPVAWPYLLVAVLCAIGVAALWMLWRTRR